MIWAYDRESNQLRCAIDGRAFPIEVLAQLGYQVKDIAKCIQASEPMLTTGDAATDLLKRLRIGVAGTKR